MNSRFAESQKMLSRYLRRTYKDRSCYWQVEDKHIRLEAWMVNFNGTFELHIFQIYTDGNGFEEFVPKD